MDWTLGDLPLDGATQPHILANIEAWVTRFSLADGIRLNAPVLRARNSGTTWALETPQGIVRARHLVAATGGHNTPVIPPVSRTGSTVREFHSGALRDPQVLAGRDVLVVGGGASAFDLLELCFQHGARSVFWVYRGLRWFIPTLKPKHIAGSVRGFARLQASGISALEQSAAIGADMRARYEKFGIGEIMPSHDFDVQHDQLIPGRPGMLANFAAIERHRGSVASITGRTVTLSDGHRLEGTCCYGAPDTAWTFRTSKRPRSPRSAPSTHFVHAAVAFLTASMPRTCISRASGSTASGPHLGLLPDQPIDHVAHPWHRNFDNEVIGHKINHFDIVDYLAPRDPASYPPDTWQAHYRDIALNTPDEQPYAIP